MVQNPRVVGQVVTGAAYFCDYKLSLYVHALVHIHACVDSLNVLPSYLQVFNNSLCVSFLSLIKIQITDILDFFLLRQNQDLMQNCENVIQECSQFCIKSWFCRNKKKSRISVICIYINDKNDTHNELLNTCKLQWRSSYEASFPCRTPPVATTSERTIFSPKLKIIIMLCRHLIH